MILFSLFFLIFYGNFWGKPRVAGLGCHWTSQGGTIQPHWIDDSLSCGLMGWTGLKNSNKLKLLLFLLVKINLFFFDDWTRSIVWKTKNEVEEAENSVANALAEHLEAELKDQLTAGKHGTVWYLVRYLVNFWCLWNARLELEYCWGFDPWIHLPSSLSWVFKDCLVMWGSSTGSRTWGRFNFPRLWQRCDILTEFRTLIRYHWTCSWNIVHWILGTFTRNLMRAWNVCSFPIFKQWDIWLCSEPQMHSICQERPTTVTTVLTEAKDVDVRMFCAFVVQVTSIMCNY